MSSPSRPCNLRCSMYVFKHTHVRNGGYSGQYDCIIALETPTSGRPLVDADKTVAICFRGARRSKRTLTLARRCEPQQLGRRVSRERPAARETNKHVFATLPLRHAGGKGPEGSWERPTARGTTALRPQTPEVQFWRVVHRLHRPGRRSRAAGDRRIEPALSGRPLAIQLSTAAKNNPWERSAAREDSEVHDCTGEDERPAARKKRMRTANTF